MDRVTPNLLAVGTTHPLNVAGLGLDVRVAAALKVRIVTIVAGVSAQSAHAVLGRAPVAPEMIAAQFAALRDVPIDAIHIGALLDARSVVAVVAGLQTLRGVPVVCDPVVAATGGNQLADPPTIAALRDELFAFCTLVTPNLHEAELLLGHPVADIEAMEVGAREICAFGAGAALVKGGHLAAEPTDVLAVGKQVMRFTEPRIAGTLRGTGDLLACAIAAGLASGNTLVASIQMGRIFVRECLASAVPFVGTSTLP